ncbi:transposase [Bradyrhizobium sp. LB14.3]
MRRILASTFDELRQLELRIAEVNREIEAIASQSDTARRLMTIRALVRWPRRRFWQQLDLPASSKRPAIWQLG